MGMAEKPRERSRFVDGMKPTKVLETTHGQLYQGDCLDLLPTLEDDSVDCVFADP
jgi:DNA modification methylase